MILRPGTEWRVFGWVDSRRFFHHLDLATFTSQILMTCCLEKSTSDPPRQVRALPIQASKASTHCADMLPPPGRPVSQHHRPGRRSSTTYTHLHSTYINTMHSCISACTQTHISPPIRDLPSHNHDRAYPRYTTNGPPQREGRGGTPPPPAIKTTGPRSIARQPLPLPPSATLSFH